MTIQVKRFPEYELNLHIYSGAITVEQVFRHFAQLEATRWIGYFEPTADVSALDVASLPRLKQALQDKQLELFGERPRPSAIVYSSREVQRFFRFWRRYIASSGERPLTVVLFSSLDAACDWLRLPEVGCEAVMAAAGMEASALVGRGERGRGSGRQA